MKRFFALFGVLTITLSVAIAALASPLASAAMNRNLIIDDTVFNDTGSMNGAQIDSWLDSNFPQSCISPSSGFRARIPNGYSPSGGFTYGGFGTAGQVIANSAGVYGINPQVLLVTLQKEQSLVAGGTSYCNDGDEHKYAAAMGYGCPDSGTVHSYTGVSLYMRNGVEHTSTGSTCVSTAAAAGFSQQVIRAAWLFKFGQQRSLGNTGWAIVSGSWDNSDDPGTCYGGPMTQGNLSRGCGQAAAPYDGYTTIDSTLVHMDSGATAALYWYTPHFHGNELFYNNFTAWFGSTISSSFYACHGTSNLVGAGTGVRAIPDRFRWGADNLALTQLNDTGSACIEAHIWNGGLTNWLQHIPTNSGSINPADTRIVTADGNGDGRDEMILINYRNTASGMLEAHVWDPTYQRWVNHVATNRPAIDPADAEVIAADPDGDGRDDLFLVQYRNTSSGMVEIHGWSPTLQQWTSHVATNRPAIDPADAEVISADTNGDGRDEFYLIQYRNTSSGRIEVHGWSPNLQQWATHIATNRPAIDPGTRANPYAEVISADLNGNVAQEFMLVEYHGTGSGRVEVHIWSPNLQQWVAHIATNQGAY